MTQRLQQIIKNLNQKIGNSLFNPFIKDNRIFTQTENIIISVGQYFISDQNSLRRLSFKNQKMHFISQ
ncbi:unnamed protein product [Paramecium octaurelia]|uniref:Uncharacterized protein n=1 Tax=Paramecium octaurelia TaxID=43137 RepID=A0A8S1X5R5_PAROT|nr:unnamed protein product [Paramecium octaurelia]